MEFIKIDVERWNEYIVSWFCLFNNNMVQFHKINQIFKKVESIKCWKVGDVDDLYFSSLLSMIKQINNLKYSVLSKIELKYVNILYSSDSFCKYSIQYKHNGWKLEVPQLGGKYIKISRL